MKKIARHTWLFSFTDVAFLLLIVEPVEQFLVLLWRHHLLFGDIHPAAHRNQQEGMQRVGAQ